MALLHPYQEKVLPLGNKVDDYIGTSTVIPAVCTVFPSPVFILALSRTRRHVGNSCGQCMQAVVNLAFSVS